MDRIHWNDVEQYFTLVLFVFQFSSYSVCNFGKFINFGLFTVRVKGLIYTILVVFVLIIVFSVAVRL